MHPIEHLRFLARSQDPSPDWLVPEAAEALDALADDRAGLVLACRKLVERQPHCGPLWWICGRVLLASNPREAARSSARAYAEDPTFLQVSMALSGSDGDHDPDPDDVPLVLPAVAAGPSGALVTVPDPALARLGGARDRGRAVWLIGGVGRILPDQIWGRATAGLDLDGGAHVERGGGAVEFVAADQFDRVIGPSGIEPTEDALARSDVAVVTELLRRG